MNYSTPALIYIFMTMYSALKVACVTYDVKNLTVAQSTTTTTTTTTTTILQQLNVEQL